MCMSLKIEELKSLLGMSDEEYHSLLAMSAKRLYETFVKNKEPLSEMERAAYERAHYEMQTEEFDPENMFKMPILDEEEWDALDDLLDKKKDT